MPAAFSNNDTCPTEHTGPDGPLVIEPEVSRVMVAMVIWIAGALFSAVPAIIIASTWGKNGLNAGTICPALFLLVGLAIDAMALYFTLKCFNPKPILALSERNIYPGTEFEISWMFQGRTQSIRKLTMALTGKEKVTYQQGTSKRNEESTFYNHILVDTEDPQQIAQGFELVRLPVDAMHSFKSANNEIIWTIEIHGDVARWPDVDDAFPIRVLTSPIVEATDA